MFEIKDFFYGERYSEFLYQLLAISGGDVLNIFLEGEDDRTVQYVIWNLLNHLTKQIGATLTRKEKNVVNAIVDNGRLDTILNHEDQSTKSVILSYIVQKMGYAKLIEVGAYEFLTQEVKRKDPQFVAHLSSLISERETLELLADIVKTAIMAGWNYSGLFDLDLPYDFKQALLSNFVAWEDQDFSGRIKDALFQLLDRVSYDPDYASTGGLSSRLFKDRLKQLTEEHALQRK